MGDGPTVEAAAADLRRRWKVTGVAAVGQRGPEEPSDDIAARQVWTELTRRARPGVSERSLGQPVRWSKSFSAICFLGSSGSGGFTASATPLR